MRARVYTPVGVFALALREAARARLSVPQAAIVTPGTTQKDAARIDRDTARQRHTEFQNESVILIITESGFRTRVHAWRQLLLGVSWL